MLASLLTSLIAFWCPQDGEVPSLWPPTGPKWETEPSVAFERARKEKKAVFAYIASEGCPHCVVMARTVWCRPEVIEASEDVVMLAIHRSERPAGDASVYTAPEWVVRLDVMAYPQVRILDRWGRSVDLAEAERSPRDQRDVTALIRAAGSRIDGDPPKPKPPAALSALVREHADLASPFAHVRAGAWRATLDATELTARQFLAAMQWESDAPSRIVLLRYAREALPAVELQSIVELGLAAPNDYVRVGAIDAVADLGADLAAPMLAALIAKVRSGTSGFSNPNNVLCAATEACAKAPHLSLIAPLAAIVENGEGNNRATLLAVEALARIGREHGRGRVKAPLQRALEIEGYFADQIREIVRAALGE